ncbi:dihydroxy-acid dehydratase [Siminovitchia acidinfaciens]|uniref:Dihydroxy-acid dehydratase n=1 Tax=Siminovitchia acidinfaciens TaxID=2321395 RepID=A0A429XWB2_9BACI|nr:dihydroxy-acid dehydratase [Siminovitchia acidinfaciens]RST72685.1 dihydroxy-acid dehydratase [Siminovitchia acidinfaciens]
MPSRIDGDYLRSNHIESSIARAFMQGAGFSEKDLKERPVVGIFNSWSEMNPCNLNLDQIAKSVREGIMEAGGLPVEIPTISIHEQINYPSSLLLRNLMAMDVEEMIKRSPVDGVVLLNGCDKTVPAQIMGAISAGKPAISLSAGPRALSIYKGEEMTIHSLWGKKEERQKGEINDKGWEEYLSKLIPGPGTCNVMGTASTMSALMEALGLALPGTSFFPSQSKERELAAKKTGRMAVEMIKEKRTPDQIVTLESLENAFRTVCALGGSTNAVIHLEAIAGRAGLRIGIDRFRLWSETTPHLVAVSPSGPYSLHDFSQAGGVPALFKRLATLLHLESRVVTGETWSKIIGRTESTDSPVLRTLDNPINPDGGLAILKGSLAPGGAVFKRSAVPKEFWTHRGPATVFEGIEDMEKRINDPNLPVGPESVIILRGMGPKGGPGMPESAKVPIPKKLWESGVRNMVRISDGRMSGTADGAVVLHVTPESAEGGPLALVQDGDIIELDAIKGRLELLVDAKELDKRRKNLQKAKSPSRGYDWLYHQHVTQADTGVDFDFLIDPAVRSR